MTGDTTDHRHRHFNSMAWLLVALILQIGVSRLNNAGAISVDYFTLWAVPATLSSAPDRNIYTHDNQRAMANAARLLSTSKHASPAQQLAQNFSDQLYDRRLDATGSPLAYALVGLSSSGRYDDDLGRFTLVSLLAFLTAIGLLCHLLGYPPTGTVMAGVAYSLCFSPLIAELKVSNVNQLQLLVLSLFLWFGLRGAPGLAGAVLGAGLMFKPNIAAVVVVAGFVALLDRGTRDTWRLFAGVGAGALLAVAAGAAYFGTFGVWGHFLASISRTLAVGYPLNHGNFALGSLVATLTGAELSIVFGTAAVSAALLVLVLTRRPATATARTTPALDEQFLIVGVGCAIMLIGSRLVWIHYYLLLIPLSLYLLRPGPPASGDRFGAIAAGVALLALSPAAMAVSNEPLHVAVMANIGTLLLFVAGLRAWWRLRRQPPVVAPGLRGKRRALGQSARP